MSPRSLPSFRCRPIESTERTRFVLQRLWTMPPPICADNGGGGGRQVTALWAAPLISVEGVDLQTSTTMSSDEYPVTEQSRTA